MLEFEEKILEMMNKRFAEQEIALAAVVVKTVNGKITAIHNEIKQKVEGDKVRETAMNKRMDKQDTKLKNIERTTGAAVRLYNGGSTFIVVSRAVAKYISIIGGAFFVLWELLKFITIGR